MTEYNFGLPYIPRYEFQQVGTYSDGTPRMMKFPTVAHARRIKYAEAKAQRRRDEQAESFRRTYED